VGDVRRLIAFDLDGTLIDSRRDLADSINLLLAELGASPLDEETVGRMVGDGARVLVQRALQTSELGEVAGALPRFLEIYDTRLLNHTRPYDGIVDAVRAAREHGHVAVLTNKPAAASNRILEGLGMRELFHEVVGGDGPLPRKPDPASLVALMDRTGTAATHTLLVGDSLIDFETAANASARCCMAAYGFGYLTFPLGRLTGYEWVVASPAEITSVIDQFVSMAS
jgi:phosphoglycolate phosphatase